MPPHVTPGDMYPCLVYADAPRAIDWLCTAFGFTRRLVVPDEDGGVRHSELSLGAGVIMVSSAKPGGRLPPGRPGGSPSGTAVYVPDPDAHHARAVQAGAEIIQPLKDEHFGARLYVARDLEGHQWCFGDYRPGAWWDQPAG